MRVRIVFGLTNKGAAVPFHHQYLVSDLIASLIEKTDSKFSSFKEYNFSGLKGQTKVGKEGLHFYSSKVTLVFASPNEEFIQFVLKQLFKYSQVEIGKLQLVPLSVEKENAPQIGEEVKYICISPMVILSPLDDSVDAKKFINPTLDSYSDFLYENVMNRMEKSGRYTAEQIADFFKFQVVPDKDYLAKIKEEEKKFARIFPVYLEQEKYEVRGYTFPFTLYAHKEVQQFVFDLGIGMFCYRGFGMLDVANADPNQRTVPYEFPRD